MTIVFCEKGFDGQPHPISLFFQNNSIIYNKNSKNYKKNLEAASLFIRKIKIK